MKQYYLLVALMFSFPFTAISAQAAESNQTFITVPNAGTPWTEPKTGMKFVWVPRGCFEMGTNATEMEKPVHTVCVEGFWMGRNEVTQKEYQQVIGTNPSLFKAPNNPVNRISWTDASHFVKTMSEFSGTKVGLPSEAQWEYACSVGGKLKDYCGVGAVEKLGWFIDNSEMTTHPVGEFGGNVWGLEDMSGNVWEWTQDCANFNYTGAPADGSAWVTGNCTLRMARGGAYNNTSDTLHVSHRRVDDMGGRDSINGIRVVRTAP
jgi:formylglycine-generating enzyme required for sulfatase activity